MIRWLEEVSMKDHATALWGEWKPSSTLNVQSHQMIEHAGNTVGCLATRVDSYALHVTRIYLAPDARNLGIGAICMDYVLDQARTAGLPVRLRVLKNNPAQRFYCRLGFHETEQTEFRVYMEHSCQPKE